MNNKIEFKNGSHIIGIDLANDSKIVRGERANLIIYDDYWGKPKNKFILFIENVQYYLFLKWKWKFEYLVYKIRNGKGE